MRKNKYNDYWFYPSYDQNQTIGNLYQDLSYIHLML